MTELTAQYLEDKSALARRNNRTSSSEVHLRFRETGRVGDDRRDIPVLPVDSRAGAVVPHSNVSGPVATKLSRQASQFNCLQSSR